MVTLSWQKNTIAAGIATFLDSIGCADKKIKGHIEDIERRGTVSMPICSQRHTNGLPSIDSDRHRHKTEYHKDFLFILPLKCFKWL